MGKGKKKQRKIREKYEKFPFHQQNMEHSVFNSEHLCASCPTHHIFEVHTALCTCFYENFSILTQITFNLNLAKKNHFWWRKLSGVFFEQKFQFCAKNIPGCAQPDATSWWIHGFIHECEYKLTDQSSTLTIWCHLCNRPLPIFKKIRWNPLFPWYMISAKLVL